jgi:hypothetical protein
LVTTVKRTPWDRGCTLLPSVSRERCSVAVPTLSGEERLNSGILQPLTRTRYANVLTATTSLILEVPSPPFSNESATKMDKQHATVEEE